jgi:transcriptional regulator with XRE-family HTH domain
MALFFDANWFDQRLASLGLVRSTVAMALGLSDQETNEIWKDQRELSARDVSILANLLDTTAAEIAERAGVSTPVPKAASSDPSLKEISERLARIETALAELTALVRSRK